MSKVCSNPNCRKIIVMPVFGTEEEEVFCCTTCWVETIDLRMKARMKRMRESLEQGKGVVRL